MGNKRETFGSRSGVIMAMAGSAIGLGNIWRFPYITGEYGGAAFILIYILCTIFLSLPIFLSESIIGRRAGMGAFGAMETLAPGTKWKWLAFLTVVSPFVILSYYSVVGGWSVAYFLRSPSFGVAARNPEGVAALFGNFISSVWGPLICHTVFLGLTAYVVLRGVRKGIEKFSTYTLPVLFVMIVFIMIYSLSLHGSFEGVLYMVKPDFSKVNMACVTSAMGQSFFSLSLGVGTILVYASYIKKEENLLTTSLGSSGFDLLFALIAGFAVMPAVFAAGIEPGSGPTLVFETLPYIFVKLGSDAPWLTVIVSAIFFFTVLVAALSSTISMMEACIAYLVEQKGLSRGKAVLILFAACWILGILCSLSFGPLKDVSVFGNTIFEACDKLTANFLMVFGGLLFTFFVGWKMKKAEVMNEFTACGTQKWNVRCFKPVYFLIRYIAPLVIVAIILSTILS